MQLPSHETGFDLADLCTVSVTVTMPMPITPKTGSLFHADSQVAPIAGEPQNRERSQGCRREDYAECVAGLFLAGRDAGELAHEELEAKSVRA
jgi:hypothetical protein